jgi:hypothetical protein
MPEEGLESETQGDVPQDDQNLGGHHSSLLGSYRKCKPDTIE